MDAVEQELANWKASLLPSIPVGGLLARNALVYKWKAPFRVWMLREAVFWRLHDLLSQSCTMHRLGHDLGARILLRSGFETLAILIYLNQLMQQVTDGSLNFHKFDDTTSVLLLGSRNNPDGHQARSILTILEKCDRQYPGMVSLYADLSESAHPNYEGLCVGYSKLNRDEYETVFSNRWTELYGERHLRSVEKCMETFLHEYNDVWSNRMDKLETWIAANDEQLEATKLASAVGDRPSPRP